MMDKCDQLHYNDNKFNSSPFQHCVLSGYWEAVDNAQTCINLKLSHFIINDNDNHRDLHSLWVMNAPNVQLLRVTVFSRGPLPDLTSSSKCDNSASSMDFELSSCQELKVLKLYGYGICLKDVVSSAASVCPVRFLLNNADPADHSSEILPSIEHIELGDVTCSTTWLQSLFNILKTLKHNVKCVLEDCEITSQMKKFDRMMRTQILSLSSFMFRSFCSLELSMVYINSPDLWKFLDGLDIKSLSLNSDLVCSTNKHAASLGHSLSLTQFKERHIHSKYDDAFGTIQLEHLIGLNITSLRLSSGLNRYAKEHVSLFSQFLSSLTRLEALSMDMFDLVPSQWKALHGLNIKNLSLCGMLNSLAKSHVFWFSQSLSSLTQLETLSMEMYDNNSGLLIGLHDLNIKNLSLTWKCSAMEHLMSQSLSSLKQLETLSMEFIWYSPCLLAALQAALHGLHIKCLSMSGKLDSSAEEHEVLFSRVLSSLTQLETLNLEISNASSGIWRALRGLNIKNLSLCGTFNSSAREHLSLISQSLSSLYQLETFTRDINNDSSGLWQALYGLNIKSLSLRGCLDSSAKELVVSVAHSLASLTQLETLSLEFSENSLGMLEALYCLNIKSLILNCPLGFSTRDHVSSLKLALSSLTHLETLSLNIMHADADLLEALHGLHIKNLNISGWMGKNHVSVLWEAVHGPSRNLFFEILDSWGIKHASLLAHSLSSLSQLETLSISLSSELSPSLSLSGSFVCLSKEHECVYQPVLPIHFNELKTYSLRDPNLRSLSFI
ncbi:hypothetical protein DPMN_137023 [Dreissena polymorpha]|uniref:Uncharacterized protein n=1 Tax=Dreissena polymorpha TaxID=45954 RepID=A0A9D4G1V0_DREPO|nr:hypothetical protein DPMN_137023 [Dreissena polymorpha]